MKKMKFLVTLFLVTLLSVKLLSCAPMHTLLSAWRALAHSEVRHLFPCESADQDVSLFLD